MKNTKKLSFLFILLFLIFTACTSKKKADISPVDTYIENNNSSSQKFTVNIRDLESLVKQAKTLNTQVVMAITILHHNELKDLENKMFDHDINAYEKEKLFENRKNDFFNKLQFSYDEYTAYIAEHSSEINEYIASHSEIMDYLRTENRGEE